MPNWSFCSTLPWFVECTVTSVCAYQRLRRNSLLISCFYCNCCNCCKRCYLYVSNTNARICINRNRSALLQFHTLIWQHSRMHHRDPFHLAGRNSEASWHKSAFGYSLAIVLQFDCPMMHPSCLQKAPFSCVYAGCLSSLKFHISRFRTFALHCQPVFRHCAYHFSRSLLEYL